MIINNISRFFYPDDKNKIFFCRNCCNRMYSQKKFDEHLQFCQTNKAQILMSSQNKYLQFKNLQSTIQHNFIVYADIESYMIHNEKNIYEHNHLMSGYYLHCINKKYSKKVKLFDKLEDFRDNLIEELDYIKIINENKLNFDIDMKNFNKEEFDKVKKCKHCDHKFNEDYNNRKITLIEKIDKYKLQRIIDDFGQNNINEETQNNLKKYYKNLDNSGEIKIIYRQNYNSGRYYSNQFSLQNMFIEVRSSIIHKDCIDIDFINSNITIIIYLAEKYKLKIPNIKKYSNDRENILKNINDDRSIAKKLILTILNSGFSQKYHDDKNINKFLKDIENESKMLHDYFYKIDKRIDDEKIFNFKGNSFARLLQDYENMLLMNLYDYFQIKKIKMMTLIFDGILLLPDQHLETLKNNKKYFNKELGLMENEISQNINEVISLMSKCYSIETVNDKNKIKSKGISKNYSEKNHTHKYFKEVLFNEINNNKTEFYRISLKNGKLTIQLQLKDDINNLNDKRYMIDNLISTPHEINL